MINPKQCLNVFFFPEFMQNQKLALPSCSFTFTELSRQRHVDSIKNIP